MLNLVLFGPPGAGKGTQSQKLISKYGLKHISTGDIFRSHVSNQTALGKQVSQIMAEGQLVPDSITIAMLEEEVAKSASTRGFIFDGFPRTVAQAKSLDVFLNSKGTQISSVIALDVNQKELTKRIAERQKQTGRLDDAADKLQRRIAEYFEKTIHVLPYYETQGKLNKVNGVGEIEDIFEKVSSILDAYTVSYK